MEGIVVASSAAKGRYTIMDDEGHEGPDLTSGLLIDICVGAATWISGRIIEYCDNVDGPGSSVVCTTECKGYCIVTESGHYILGLCTGMYAKIQ